MDYNKAALEMHETHKGKVGITSKVEVKTRDDLSTAYTPGVAEPCRKIKENPDDVYKYTFKSNMVAVVSNGTAVLGLGDIGPGFVAICLFFFAFTTIVGWYFFGEQYVKYLLGLRWVQSYRVLVLCFLMLGSFLHVTLVWELADFFNGIMVIPNVIALLALSGLVAKVLKDYDTKFMLGETPEYGALSPSGGEPFSLEPSPRKGRRFSRLKLRLRRKKTPPVNLDEMDQLKERRLDRF